MKEDILQHIWQYQRFDKQDLRTQEGQPLQIIRIGHWNTESGPDFLQAQIIIGDMAWFGSVEIHIHAKDWKYHKHHLDPAFDNVILHVVWEGKKSIQHQDGTSIPTLVLKDRVQLSVLKQYQKLVGGKHKNQLACAHELVSIPSIHKLSVLEKAALKRIERKSAAVKQCWIESDKNWHQAAFRWICRAYGFKVNAEAFATLGSKLSYHDLQKEKNSFENVTAFLFAFSGLNIDQFCTNKIINNSQHLYQKYSLKSTAMQKHEFRWSRLRPANFPEIRLVQLAALLYQLPDVLGFLLHVQRIEDLLTVFEDANKVIITHRNDFPQFKILGRDSMFNIMINAVVSFRYAFGLHEADDQIKDSAVDLIQQIPAEQNRFTKMFTPYGFPIKTALESQGVLEQYQFACQKKLCLQCPIGVNIMKNHDLVVN